MGWQAGGQGFKINLDIPSVATKVVSDLHERAGVALIEQAREMKADAVVGVRFELSHGPSDMATVCVYGTAVKFGQSVPGPNDASEMRRT